MKTTRLLGILGGLGPMSTVYFYRLLTAHTKATCDKDHIDMLISSRATTPDRTDFILGRSDQDPLPVMLEEAQRLIDAGADLLVLPCNTAHYFYKGLCEHLSVPMLNIIEETIRHLKDREIQTFGLLATEGTVRSGAYEQACNRLGLTCLTPTAENQELVSSAIYDAVKQNRPANISALSQVATDLLERGCEALVLGCTELSLLKEQLPEELPLVDSLEVLAYRTILRCGKTPIGFPADFDGEAAR